MGKRHFALMMFFFFAQDAVLNYLGGENDCGENIDEEDADSGNGSNSGNFPENNEIF